MFISFYYIPTISALCPFTKLLSSRRHGTILVYLSIVLVGYHQESALHPPFCHLEET